MIKIRVKSKQARKPVILEVKDRQEAHALARGILSGMQVRIIEDGPAPKRSNIRGHTQAVWSDFNMNEGGVCKANRFQDWLDSTKKNAQSV